MSEGEGKRIVFFLVYFGIRAKHAGGERLLNIVVVFFLCEQSSMLKGREGGGVVVFVIFF